MDRKSYAQICPVARALDVVGDRWTLLLLRELLGGPARFNEVEAGLPGIAKNLLTRRLRQLEDDGIIERTKSHGTTLYKLTELGAGVRPAVEALGFWGARVARLAPPEHGRSIRATAMALQAIVARAPDAREAPPSTIEVEVDDDTLEIVLGPSPTVTVRAAPNADAFVRASLKALTSYLNGKFDEKRFTHVSGDASVTETLLRALRAMA